MTTQLVAGPNGTWSIVDTAAGTSKPIGVTSTPGVPVPTTTGISTIPLLAPFRRWVEQI
jgi:hypothetical protein